MGVPTAPKIKTLTAIHLAARSGVSMSIAPALRWLAEEGEVYTVLPEHGQVADDYESFSSVSILPYEALTLPRAPREGIRSTLRLSHEVGVFRREIRRIGPDLVVVPTSALPVALVAARLERVPTIVRVAELFSGRSVSGRARTLPAWALLRSTEGLASAILCASDAVAQQFRGGHTRVITSYAPIDTSPKKGDGEAFRRRHGLREADPLIVVIGNLSPGRGQDLLIEAMPRIVARWPQAACALVGRPHPRELDRRYADGLPALAGRRGVADAVCLPGFTPEIEDVFAACDLVVNPARVNETFGRVSCEALMAGRPVVATRAGAIPEILRDGRDALLVDVEDAPGLANAITRILSDRELAQSLVASGRERVESKFSEANFVARFADAALSVLQR
jgi:glycosyltransferase involved in cell wall biosynthesis